MNKLLCAVLAALLCPAVASAADESQSLYDQASYRPLVSEEKAYRLGDVLTVIVQEAATASTSADSRAQRSTAVSAEIGSNRAGPHSAAANAATDADGGGRTQRSGRLLATLSVRVTGLTPGGDLVVQGQQVLTINGESQSIVLSGVVRPRDVGDGNTVLSSRIAEARIEFDGEGFIADKSRPSWISRFLSALGF